MGFPPNDLRSNYGAVNRRINRKFQVFNLFQEGVNGTELAGQGEGFENGLVGDGSVGEARLLGCPVEEAQSEGVVIEKQGIDDSGDERGREKTAATEFVENVLERRIP